MSPATEHRSGRPGAAEPDTPRYPKLACADPVGRARLVDLVDAVVRVLGFKTKATRVRAGLVGAIDRVVVRDGTIVIHWHRPASSMELAAFGLASLQVGAGQVEHLTAVRRGGGA